ncbi:MAG: hypothetical protein HYS27_28785 [Deltaproteobacteria bacterium]|nr:hypothetical protein [Deltaproteobacteria bacterium]
MSRSTLVQLAGVVVLASTGCMGWWQPDVDVDRPRRSLEELRDRDREHADACAGWGALEDADDEPDRYVGDVYLLTDDMVDACADMMAAGRIDRDDYDDVDEMRGRLRIAVDDHRVRIDVEVDIDGLHEACVEHHQAMLELFDETEDRLAAGGMMGGGMM